MKKQLKIKEDLNERIDKYLAQLIDKSRSSIQDLIANGYILVNNGTVKPSYKLVKGDRITITEPKEEPIKPQAMDLKILYEDKDILVLNKPEGLLVHPTDHQKTDTLVNGLLAYTDELGNKDSPRPGIVHRLDKDTSGIMVVAKTDAAYTKLVESFSSGSVKRYYYALLEGHLKEKIAIDEPIGRDPITRIKMAVVEGGRDSKTILEPVEYIDNYSFVRAELLTGRTHQIRVHSSYIGLPVVGDGVYGHPNHHGTTKMMLHAYKLGFNHPITNEYIEIKSELPSRMEEFINKFK